jgi:hypothetical protein
VPGARGAAAPRAKVGDAGYPLLVATPLMVHLTTVGSMFEARVVMARMGAEGILTQLGGGGEGPYPLPGPVEILVIVDQAGEARELLLADQVEALFESIEEDSAGDP